MEFNLEVKLWNVDNSIWKSFLNDPKMKECDYLLDCKLTENNIVFRCKDVDEADWFDLIENVSLCLLIDYIEAIPEFRRRKKEIISVIIHERNEFIQYMGMELLTYIQNQSILKEQAFFSFNLNSFHKDIEKLISQINASEERAKQIYQIQGILKRKKIRIEDFKACQVIRVGNNKYGICVKNKTITQDTFLKEFGVQISPELSLEGVENSDLIQASGILSFFAQVFEIEKFIFDESDRPLYEYFKMLLGDMNLHIQLKIR